MKLSTITTRTRRRARRILREQQGDRCIYCRAVMDFGHYLPGHWPANWASIEHLVPKSANGEDDASNLALACLGCNHDRNDEYQRRAVDRARSVSMMPPARDQVVMGRVG